MINDRVLTIWQEQTAFLFNSDKGKDLSANDLQYTF